MPAVHINLRALKLTSFRFTAMLCSLLEMGMSFVPAAKLKKIFPPIVTGVVVFLIGASLIGDSGLLAWGGGSK